MLISTNAKFLHAEVKGMDVNDRFCTIQGNEARYLYLKSYRRIDMLEHFIKNTEMHYRSWNHWHAVANRSLDIVVVVTHYMLVEVVSGALDE